MSITQQWSILPAFDTDLAGRESKYLREIWFAFLRHVCSLLKCCGSSFLNNHFLLWWVLKSWRRNSSFVGEKFYFKIEGFLIVEFKKFEKAQKSQLSNCPELMYLITSSRNVNQTKTCSGLLNLDLVSTQAIAISSSQARRCEIMLWQAMRSDAVPCHAM